MKTIVFEVILVIFSCIFCYWIYRIATKPVDLDMCKPRNTKEVAVKYYNGECAIWPIQFVQLGRR